MGSPPPTIAAAVPAGRLRWVSAAGKGSMLGGIHFEQLLQSSPGVGGHGETYVCEGFAKPPVGAPCMLDGLAADSAKNFRDFCDRTLVLLLYIREVLQCYMKLTTIIAQVDLDPSKSSYYETPVV